MRFLWHLSLAGLLWFGSVLPGQAQGDLTALARLTGPGVLVEDGWAGEVTLTLDMTRPVPWRLFTLTDPKRLVLDFAELDWGGFDSAALVAESAAISTARAGLFRPGWTRLVVELDKPMAVTKAGMTANSDGTARVRLQLADTDDETFAASAGAPPNALFVMSGAEDTDIPPHHRQTGERPLVVVLDPGHGGIDPGAEREGAVEADLMLTFARELKDILVRNGNFNVVLTREDNVFVPLETRVTIARRAGADVFMSLHADALAQGRASGATVYTLSEEASDLASEKLAERHDRADLLAGVDLTRQGDQVALVLMDLARLETAPRSVRLADALIEGIYAATGSSHKTGRLEAGFSVLKAPDIPSVLIELGFLSSDRDRNNLLSQPWRQAAAEGIRDALLYWRIEDAAEAVRLRQ